MGKSRLALLCLALISVVMGVLLLATWARINTEEVIFHLRKGAIDGQDLVTIHFGGPSVDDDSYRSFLFTALHNSSGENYWVILIMTPLQPR